MMNVVGLTLWLEVSFELKAKEVKRGPTQRDCWNRLVKTFPTNGRKTKLSTFRACPIRILISSFLHFLFPFPNPIPIRVDLYGETDVTLCVTFASVS